MRKTVLLLAITLISCYSYAWKVDTLSISSRVMNRDIPNIVVVPENYGTGSESDQEPYPVLYLLHGAGGTYKSWTEAAPITKELADRYNMIIVCPDGGVTSWYFDSPIDKNMQYESYITEELLKEIDERYNTVKGREGRAITGLSMGGHGAMYLALRHQNIWGAVGSTSGGLDLRPFPNSWNISKRIGEYSENRDIWEESSVVNMIYLLDGKSMDIIFDCGVDDFFYDANKRVHEKLLQRNIPHDYIERPGGHNAKYWRNAIEYQMLFFNKFFQERE